MPCCAAGENTVSGSCCECAEQSPLLATYSGAVPDLSRVKEEPLLPAFALPKLRTEACAQLKTYNRSSMALVTGPDKLYLLHGSLLI